MRRRKHPGSSSHHHSISGPVSSVASNTFGTPSAAVSAVHSNVATPATACSALSNSVDEDSSGSSLVTAADSMRPLAPPARKRRKTILDAFSDINLNKSSVRQKDDQQEDDDDADSSQAVADVHHEDVTTASSIDEDGWECDGENNGFAVLLSDREEAERKVMLEMVLGEPLGLKNPMDVKLQSMLRASLNQAGSGASSSTPANGGMTFPSPSRRIVYPTPSMMNDKMQDVKMPWNPFTSPPATFSTPATSPIPPWRRDQCQQQKRPPPNFFPSADENCMDASPTEPTSM